MLSSMLLRGAIQGRGAIIRCYILSTRISDSVLLYAD